MSGMSACSSAGSSLSIISSNCRLIAPQKRRAQRVVEARRKRGAECQEVGALTDDSTLTRSRQRFP